MIALIRQAADEHQRIDTLERSLMTQLLALGHSLLGVFLARQGEGDQGETIPTEGRAMLSSDCPSLTHAATCPSSASTPSLASCTALGKARRSSECPWMSNSACPRATSPTSSRTGRNASA